MDTMLLDDERGPIVWSDMETSAISNTTKTSGITRQWVGEKVELENNNTKHPVLMTWLADHAWGD